MRCFGALVCSEINDGWLLIWDRSGAESRQDSAWAWYVFVLRNGGIPSVVRELTRAKTRYARAGQLPVGLRSTETGMRSTETGRRNCAEGKKRLGRVENELSSCYAKSEHIVIHEAASYEIAELMQELSSINPNVCSVGTSDIYFSD